MVNAVRRVIHRGVVRAIDLGFNLSGRLHRGQVHSVTHVVSGESVSGTHVHACGNHGVHDTTEPGVKRDTSAEADIQPKLCKHIINGTVIATQLIVEDFANVLR